MNTLLFIAIVVMLASLVYMLIKYRAIKAELHSKELVQSTLGQSEMVLRNINVYFLLIDKNFIVCDTNYYSLNGLSIPVEGMVKRVGELLHCRNAITAGECGAHEHCKLCSIRMSIGKAFQKKGNFKKLGASMNLLSTDGTTVTPCDVSVSGTYLDMKGEDHMVLTIYDVTELKNMQRLLKIEKDNALSAERLRAAFIQNMSHEVRTPLNAIVGFSGLMMTASNAEEQKAYADIIAENNERLLHLVDDIFDLSQIEAGSLNFEFTEFDANDLLREVYGIFSLKLADNSEIELLCQAELQPIMMYSEHKRIVQVITSLLHNAMKFTKSGEIRFSCQREGTDEVRFSVSDTGIGIPQEEQAKIFAHFAKLDREVPGTGLGLTLSQTIVQNLGGRFMLESEVNKGSTFWFVLPLIAKLSD